MLRKVLFCKIHMPTVTRIAPDYMGSLTVDADLLDASGLRVSDAITVANCRSGERFETYIFRGAPGSGAIEVNGAAARLAEVGDRLIVMHYAWMDAAEYARHRPTVLLMQPNNRIERVIRYEPSPG
jgi:aspartate 1-decarboxylase